MRTGLSFLITCLSVLAPATAPAQIPTTPGLHHLTTTHNGVVRKFLLMVPNSYSAGTEVPLMFCFHGSGQTIQGFVYDKFDPPNGGREELLRKADAEGFILVFPEALFNAESGKTSWNSREPYPQTNGPHDDIGLVQHLIALLRGALSIDGTRLYAAGFSNGAGFTALLGSQLPCTFAALACIAGGTAHPASWTDTTLVYIPVPTRPVSTLIVRGRLDNKRPLHGGINVDGVRSTSLAEDRDFWLFANGCDTSAYTTDTYGVDTVVVRTYAACGQGTEVRTVGLKLMRHFWPDRNNGYHWDANAEVIDFLKRFNSAQCSTTGIVGGPGIQREVTVHPNPFVTTATIRSTGPIRNGELHVHDASGRKVRTMGLSGEAHTLHRDGLPSGLYTIRVIEGGAVVATAKLVIAD